MIREFDAESSSQLTASSAKFLQFWHRAVTVAARGTWFDREGRGHRHLSRTQTDPFHTSSPSISLCFLEKPVDFGALDCLPVIAHFLLISPTGRMHLHLMSRSYSDLLALSWLLLGGIGIFPGFLAALGMT